MVRAAVTGAIDFQHADPLNESWWLRLKWTLEEMLRQIDVDLWRIDLDRANAYLASSPLVPDSWAKQQQNSIDARDSIYKLTRPWVKELTTEDKIKDGTSRYESTFGEMDSEEHKKAEAKLLAWFEYNLKNPPPFGGHEGD